MISEFSKWILVEDRLKDADIYIKFLRNIFYKYFTLGIYYVLYENMYGTIFIHAYRPNAYFINSDLSS